MWTIRLLLRPALIVVIFAALLHSQPVQAANSTFDGVWVGSVGAFCASAAGAAGRSAGSIEFRISGGTILGEYYVREGRRGGGSLSGTISPDGSIKGGKVGFWKLFGRFNQRPPSSPWSGAGSLMGGGEGVGCDLEWSAVRTEIGKIPTNTVLNAHVAAFDGVWVGSVESGLAFCVGAGPIEFRISGGIISGEYFVRRGLQDGGSLSGTISPDGSIVDGKVGSWKLFGRFKQRPPSSPWSGAGNLMGYRGGEDCNMEWRAVRTEVGEVLSEAVTNVHVQERSERAREQSPPEIKIDGNLEASVDNFILKGRALDESGVDRVEVAGETAKLSSNGSFEASFYVPHSGRDVDIIATDIHGNRATKTVSVARTMERTRHTIRFPQLDPTGIKVLENERSIALVIGIGDYSVAPDALFADLDAEYFYDYVHRAFGVPNRNIKLLRDKEANLFSVKRAVKRWLPGNIHEDKTDVYIFFAGHGLASKNGQDLYLLPENGQPDLLEDSAIMRNEIYDVLKDANPRSVTVFLDTCFSGGTRGDEMLVADARSIRVAARDSLAPDRFTVFTASAGDEISSSLPGAKHGLFSYFLMQGLGGEADANANKQITAGELHAYVSDNVSRQALRLGRVQTPQLQGDAERVLVRW